MKEMRRIIALVLSLVMVVGMVPVSAFAAEADVDYLFFATDRHGNGSIINTLLTKMQSDGAAIEYVGLGGDMVNSQSSYNTKAILDDEVNAALNPDLDYTQVDFIKGSHDNNASDTSGYEMFHKKSEQLYAEEDYVVYGVIQSDMESATGAATTFASWAEKVDADKVIIVLSHLPIHEFRNDNQGAAAWHAALNSVADSNGDGTVDRNVIFFHGHNHSQDPANYFYNVGDGITVEGMSGSQTNYYTYATAGYLKDNSQATLVTVTDTAVTLTRYGTSSATELTTVKRVATSTEPQETTAPTTEATEAQKEVGYMTISEGSGVAYVVGDTQILYKMFVSYTDGTTGYVDQDDCTLTIYNEAGEVVTEAEALATVGTYSADVTYLGETCGTRLTFTVSASGPSSYDLLNLIINGAEVTADVKNVTADVADAMSGLDIDSYVAYDITANLAEGATATVSIPVPAEWADTDLAVYHVTDEGTLSNETFEDAAYADGYVTFTVSHFSTYVVTTQSKDEDGTDVDVPGSSTSQNKDVWVKVDTLTDGEEYLIVSTGTAGTSGYIMGNSAAVTPVSGSLTVNNATGTYTYFETATGTLWTASGSGTSWSFENSDGKYLGYTNNYYSYPLNTTSGSETEWTMGDNTLSVYVGYRTRYVRYSNGWQLSTSSGNVYFYQKVNATVHSGTQDAEYGINITVNGTAASAMNANNVVSGDTLTLGTEFTSTVTGQAPASGGTYTWTATTNNGVASVDNSGKVTFTGKAGTETVQVSYTWTENGTQYTISNTLVITTTAMTYSMNITEENLTVKIDAKGTATLVAQNSEGNTVTASNVTWTTSDDTVATVSNGTITGKKEGTATITAAWTDPAGVNHTDSVVVTVVDAVYVLTIDQGDATTKKGVKADQTLELTATLTADGATVPNPTLTWFDPYLADGSSATSIAYFANEADKAAGKLTFTGAEGMFKVMVTYTSDGGSTVNDIIEITARKSTATTPSESTTDFPRWPDPGAIRFDKTAAAVGNFSETGIAQVELSMAGLPVGTSGGFDVIVPIDWTSSMDESVGTNYDRYAAAVDALQAFLVAVMIDDNDQFTDNRVLLYLFQNQYVLHIKLNSGTATNAFEKITAETISGATGSTNKEKLANWLESAITVSKLDTQLSNKTNRVSTTLDRGYTASDSSSGNTFYSYPLKAMYDKYSSTAYQEEAGNRKRYCVFMTDGGPSGYYYAVDSYAEQEDGSYTYSYSNRGSSTIGSWVSSSSPYTANAKPELYSLKARLEEDVTVFTVGLGVSTAGDPYSSYADARYRALVDALLTQIASPSSDDLQTYYPVTDSDAGDGGLSSAFENIATSIKSAASNVLVEDTIGKYYDLIFELPSEFTDAEAANAGLTNQEFYIEVLDYPLDNTTHERTGAATVLQRIYLETVNGEVTIREIKSGDINNLKSAGVTPVFTAKAKAEDKAYYTWTDTNNNGVADVGEYQNVPDGTGTHHMTAGAYVVLENDRKLKELHAANFMYDVPSEQLRWNVAEMSQTSEVALRYFVYLDKSGGVNPELEAQIAAGTYYTNEEATLTYTNFKGTECLQYFPVPQMTWNGAQVSYVFYLVNEAGVPVNRAGREVKFAEAVFVTDVHTHAIYWNDLEQSAGLEASHLAKDLIPTDYRLYDALATYRIHVYEKEDEVNLNNHFILGGTSGDKTTYVYNNKTDVKKYNTHGAYAATSTYLCKGDGTVTATISAVTDITAANFAEQPRYIKNAEGLYELTATYLEGTTYYSITAASYEKVTGETQWQPGQNDSTSGGTVIGGHVYYIDEFGEVYTIVEKSDATAIAGFDFANTTVAFAVVWEKKLVDDTVVVDFGLPVDINVTSNDFVYNHISALGTALPNNVTLNTGAANNASFSAQELTINGHKATVQNENVIRFTPGSGDSMIFNEPVSFYYESPVDAYVDGEIDTDYMYAKVTVIPATTVYYEDSFVDFAVSTKGDSGWAVAEGETWEIVGSTDSNATQAQDRPGESQISSDLDADNLYGFDGAYTNRSTYSLGSARKISVNPNRFGTAEFTFYGTGFDVISLTSNNTGFITTSVYDTETGNLLKTFGVDTYYGYSYLPCKITMQRTPTGWYESARDVVTEAEYNAGNKEKPGNELVLPNGSITYYYEMRWVATPGKGDNSNSIYQIPVISVDLLAHGYSYGQYTVVVKCAYNKYLDHTNDPASMTSHTVDSYDFILDAIRIYNPAGGNNDIANDAYEKDGEQWPVYEELRNKVLDLEVFMPLPMDTLVPGMIFIDDATNADTNKDGILDKVYEMDDYLSYGPNNELYLAKGQAVTFVLDAPVGGLNNVQLALKTLKGSGSVKVYGVEADANDNIVITNGLDLDLNTATDMYYDITKLNGKTVVIHNDSTSETVISITKIKATYEASRPLGLIVDGRSEYTQGEDYVEPEVSVYYAGGITKKLESGQYTVDKTVNTEVIGGYDLSYTYEETVSGVEYLLTADLEVDVVAPEEEADDTVTTVNSFNMVKMSRNAAALALRSMNTPPVEDTGSGEPEATEPETTEPETTEPEATEPEATEPETTEPEATEPEATEPEVTEPEATEPEATKPENNGSQNNKPEADKPDSNKPEADNNAPGTAAPEGGNTNGDDAVVDDSEVEIPDAEPDEAPETGDEPVEEVTGFWGLLKKVVEFLFGWLLKLK